AGVRNRHDQIRFRRAFTSEQTAQHLAGFLYVAAENDRVRPGEIDMLEHAFGQVPHGSVALARDALRADDDHLARLDVVEIHGADQVEGASFRRKHVTGFAARQLHLAYSERAEAVRIAGDNDAIGGQEDERERALELQHGFAQRARQGALARAGYQVQND